ncbi:MAG: tail fiber domain-containing protein, partial [Bacteroidota bacterium]
TGSENTFLGNLAGDLNTTGNLNTFVGHQAGTRNKVGIANTFIGHGTGEANESGRLNTFVGSMAGKSNTFGSQNTFIGYLAGTNNQSGAGNVFLGYQAGGNETGSSKLYIDNTATNDPLIYGDFSDNTATIHGSLGIGIKNPERPIHLRDARAIFRIDRDRADPGFAVVRYDQGFQNVWKSFYFYTLGTGVDQGKFIIADWGTDVSGPDHIARLVVANNGNVGIGNFLNSNPAEKLTVSGNAQANSFLVSSDKRYKKNIRGISGALESLDQIQGVTYAFNQEAFEEKDLPEGRSLGLIAQEVQKVYPELVREDAEGYLSVNYDGLIPVLIEALKAQKEYFEARISKLEARDQQEETADEVAPNRLAQLYQNTPNPFDQDTKISFFLPESTQKAQLFIYDLQGKQIKKVTIQDRGEASVDFQARALEAGMYFYSLMADGEEVAMKRMMITE